MESFLFVLMVCFNDCTATYFRTELACEYARATLKDKRNRYGVCLPLGIGKGKADAIRPM